MPRNRYDDEYDDDDRDYPRRRRPRRDDDEYDDRRPRRSSGGGGGKSLLLILGIVGGVLLVVGGLAGVAVWFAFGKVKEAGARRVTQNNATVVVLGLHNYEMTTNQLPCAYVHNNPAGTPPPANPADRLSWRVEVLPYIEQEGLYWAIDRSQAWNSPKNQPFTGKHVPAFGDPLDPADATTRFRCFYDNGAAFSSDPNKRRGFGSIADGTSNTIFFAEAADPVPWAQFNEWAFDPNGPLPQLGHPKRDVFFAVMGDASVRVVRKTVNPATLKAAITADGGEVLPGDW